MPTDDPTGFLSIFTSLDPGVMAAIGIFALVLRGSTWPRWAAVSVPMVIGALWGSLTVDWTWLNRAEVFSSVLLNSAGGTFAARSLWLGAEMLANAVNKPKDSNG